MDDQIDSTPERDALKGEDTLSVPATEEGVTASMGDIDFVAGKVREMVGELILARIAYHNEEDGQAASAKAASDMAGLVSKWSSFFSPDNTDVAQTFDVAGQAAWLREHGYGTEDHDDGDPLRALIAKTLSDITATAIAHEDGGIDDDTARFRTAATIEDCVSMLMGVENSGDEG